MAQGRNRAAQVYRLRGRSICRLDRASSLSSPTATSLSPPMRLAADSPSLIWRLERSTRYGHCRRTTSEASRSHRTERRWWSRTRCSTGWRMPNFDDVHWGLLVRNHLRVLRVDALTKPGSDAALLEGSRLFDLGDVGYAAGDPGPVVFDARGDLIVALAGVNEIAITASPDQGPRRVVVGRRPTALAPSPDGSVVYVANALDDTVSVVEIGTGQHRATITLGPEREPTAAERGESLFYNAKLAHDGWMSCHSCHTDGHTNNLSSDTLGDGSYGAPKRVPSLFGVGTTGPWTWTGSMARLEDQVKKSIMTTMQGPKPSDEQVSDLTAYLKSLAPPPAARCRPRGGPGRGGSWPRGLRCAASARAAMCRPSTRRPERYDVGLADEVGNHEFNPPSLRAVSRRETLLHDGRARSLEDVFRKEHHPRGLTLSVREIDDLVAFLNTL